jgi:hypothetical protein
MSIYFEVFIYGEQNPPEDGMLMDAIHAAQGREMYMCVFAFTHICVDIYTYTHICI